MTTSGGFIASPPAVAPGSLNPRGAVAALRLAGAGRAHPATILFATAFLALIHFAKTRARNAFSAACLHTGQHCRYSLKIVCVARADCPSPA